MDAVLNDLSIMVKDNFNLEEDEQRELLAEVHQFYFENNKTVIPNSLPHAIDVSTSM